jgi:hypothetical protein
LMDEFRGILTTIQLPRPLSVDVTQAMKDANRETIIVGDTKFVNDAKGVCSRMKRVLQHFVYDRSLIVSLVNDVIRASSRTSWGGDSFQVVTALLSDGGIHPVTSDTSKFATPIVIQIEKGSGVISIHCTSAFLIHFSIEDIVIDSHDNLGAKGIETEFSHQKSSVQMNAAQSSLFNRVRSMLKIHGPATKTKFPMTNSDSRRECDMRRPSRSRTPLSISTEMKITLGVLDGNCERSLSVNHNGYSYSWVS